METSQSDEEDSSKSLADKDNAEALRIKIKQLKKDLAYHNSILNELKKQNSKKDIQSFDECHSPIFENAESFVDIEADLYQFAGFHCVKLDKLACVFLFLSGHKVSKNDIYAVEILKIGDQQRLGRWVMPMSIDLQDLVLEYPLDNPKNTKPFLKCIKHHIDCHFSRREQYYELKDFLSDTKNCFLDTTLGYLQVHLHISGIKMINSDKIYNISLYMAYDSDRAFPNKMAMELREGKLLPPEVVPHFSKYFKPFKRYHLQKAFEKIISDTRVFQWTKVSLDCDEFALFMDDEHGEEEPDEFDDTESSRKLNKKKGKQRNKKKNAENDTNDDLTDSEGNNSGNESASSEERGERSKPRSNANKTRAKESTNVKGRRKSKHVPNLAEKNANIKKYFKTKNKSKTEENDNAIEENEMVENRKENSKEGENSKELEHSKEREHSIEKENLREKENEQIDKTNAMINSSDNVKNDNVEMLNDGNDKIVNEVEKNASLKETTLSKSNEQIETKVVGKAKKSRGVKKNIKKSNVNNLSIKSVTNVDAVKNDKALMMIPANVIRNNVISSTPISGKVQAKLCSSQCSDISEISLPANGKSKKDHTIGEQDIPVEEKLEEDTISSSISDDISKENEEAKELLRDLQSVLEKDETMKNNTQKKTKKTKKKKGK